ncbi:MAG TPA: hypothetical protein VF782_02510 [Allosphingosinicella sp.]|jgi:hypothetical protein
MRITFGTGLLLAMAIPWAMASAQHPMVLAKLQEINAKAPQPAVAKIEAAVIETLKAMAAARGTCVPQKLTIADVAPATGSRDVLQGVVGGQLRNGWTAYATHGGCPGTEPFRYLIIEKSDGSLLALQVNEGRSLASPAIMRDTSMQAALMALQKAKSLDSKCDGRDMAMGAARVVGQSKDLGPQIYGARYVGTWSEAWRFTTCGKTFEVTVHFTPDGDGGAYTNVKGDQVAVVK